MVDDDWVQTAKILGVERDAALAKLAAIEEEVDRASAHRFDFDRANDPVHVAWLSSLGEQPKGGPDSFYNGAQFVARRIRNILAA